MQYLRYILLALILLMLGITPEGEAQKQPGIAESVLKLLDRQAIRAYNAADYTTALEKWRFALSMARLSGNREYTGHFLSVIGVANIHLEHYQQALTASEEALAIRRELGNRYGEGVDLSNIGLVYSYLGHYQQALDSHQQALSIHREFEDRKAEAKDLSNIALLHTNLQQYPQALDYSRQALALKHELGDRQGEGDDLHNLGVIHMKTGQYQQALEYLQQNLKLRREFGDRQGEGGDLNTIGRIYGTQGQYQQALDYFQQALEIGRETGNRYGESENLGSIGIVYWYLGQPQEALSYYKQALEIDRAIGNKNGEAVALDNIGVVYGAEEQYQQALKYFRQALAIEREIGDRHGEGGALTNIGLSYRKQGHYQEALAHFQQALTLKREIGDRRGEGVALLNIGAVYGDLGEYQRAYKALRNCIDIHAALGNIEQLWKAQRELAYVEVLLQQLEDAVTTYEFALNNIESLRAGLAQKEHKLSFMQGKLHVYDELLDLLFRLHKHHPDKGYARKALEIFERKQGRIFLEEMGQSGARLFAGLPKTIVQRETELETQLEQLRNRLSGERASAVSDEGRERIKTLEQHEKILQSKQQALQTRIKSEYPDYHALRYPRPAALSEIQNEVLREDELMLIYGVMWERTGLWLIGREEFGMFSIEIGEDALTQKVAELRETLWQEWDTERRERGLALRSQREQKPEKRTSFVQLSHELYNILIPEEVRPQLTDQHTLNIVPTGPLYALPFELLVTNLPPNPLPKGEEDISPLLPGEGAGVRFLIEEIPISYLSSASLLKTLREAQARRSSTARYPLLAFADPAYRVPQESDSIRALRDRSYRNFFGGDFAELPETADEAKAIAELLEAPQESEPLQLRENAARSKVFALNAGERLDDYHYLLFAMHGVLPGNADHVTQPALVLFDDYLTMGDVFGLKLNARLVSLSACNTGRGVQVRGEGVMGLTRAFMYAGTPAVAVTLWSVESLSAKELDIGFFRFLNKGHSPARALQAIKLQMLRGEIGEEYHNPYYWAPFVIFGDNI
ncbi:MAG: tetratricopeptide repeat protein [bacterium]|nr:tetratricopeptide repeat protein [bacterium]